MIIRPARSIQGEITLPGDKSISHRAAIIAAMADGESRIGNYSPGHDCASTLRCLRQLGVKIEQEGLTLVINGVGKSGFVKPSGPLDCGNSGTTIRLLAGLLAGQKFESVLTGDESLRKRPMERIVEPLREMGADIATNGGLPPLTIRPVEGLKGIEYKTPIASAQVKSCLLLAGLNAEGRTLVRESFATRDHTERMLKNYGADLQVEAAGDGTLMTISPDSVLTGREVQVPGDISASAFFLVAAASLPGSELTISGLGLNPTRTAMIEVLRSCGVELEVENGQRTSGEPRGDVRVRNTQIGNNKGLIIEGRQTAELIDELPILAVLGTQLMYGIEVRDAAELRIKETDRIISICENLRRMNANVEEFDDGFRVQESRLKGAVIDPCEDHRIAMAFAIAGLLAEGETTIGDPEFVDISFPGFFETLESVVIR